MRSVDINGYEGLYKIFEDGRVYAYPRIKISWYRETVQKSLFVKTTTCKGYIYIALTDDNSIKRRFLLHRLIAEHFIPNTFNKPEVNHKNGIKVDNRLENLEWCTRSENLKHAFSLGLFDKTKMNAKVKKRVKETISGHIYESLAEAARVWDFPRVSLRKMLNGVYNNYTSLEWYDTATKK